MSAKSSVLVEDNSEKIIALVRKIHEAQQQLRELTDGEVDAVVHPDGHSYLLHEAQEKLRESETAQRQLAETQMAILNALPAHIALVDSHGVIISTNEAWRRFATANALQGPEFGINRNYLKTCDEVQGEGSEVAQTAARGIRQVLKGEVETFSTEYPCHSPDEKRWFNLIVTPVRKDYLAGAVIMHIDITALKLAEEAGKQIQQQILWKTALLEAQINSTLDGILIVNLEGIKVLQNKRMVELWNIPPDIGDEEEHQRRRGWITSQIKNPRPFTEKVDYLYAHPDEVGRDELELVDGRFIDRYSAPVRGPDETYYGRIWVYRDITDRKLTQKRLADQVELVNMASRVGKLGAWAIEYPGPKLKWSEEVYRIHEVESGSEPDLETALDFFPPASRKKLEAAIQSGQTYDLELDFITAKGNKRWVRTTSAIEMKDGKLHRLYGTFQDLTDRKRTESRFNRLVNSNVQSVLFWNTKGEITDANDAFLNLVGYTREDLNAGRINWRAMTPPEYAHLDVRALEEIADHQVTNPYEKEFIRKDGSRVAIFLGAATFEDNPQEGVCFMLDLTERKKLEQQFLRAQRMESIGTLAGGIAHDLNNILAPIMMSIDILKLTAADPQAKNILDTIEVSAKRGADIVRQVLSFARGLEGERIEVQPKHLLKDLESIIRDTFPKDIQMQFSVPEETWTILGDPTQVHQILLNLCVNARDAMPHGGKLKISVENCVVDEQYAVMNDHAKAGRYVNISVTDSGMGIPPAILDKIFEPFFTTKELNKGTGLGLSTVMAVVKSHDGIVNVYSEPGKGTTFKVYLPAMETSTEVRKKQTQQLGLARGKGETILVVDDEASILTITSQTLQAFGYRVLTAADGAEALAIYAEQKNGIAAVLTDMMMPVMDGMAVIRVLMRINPAVKIIAASGLNANGDVTAVSGGAVKHFLTKPYTARTLLTAIREILDES
jgi:PAS domain S-box-containing protein